MAPLIFLAQEADMHIIAQTIRINVSFCFIRQKYIFNGSKFKVQSSVAYSQKLKCSRGEGSDADLNSLNLQKFSDSGLHGGASG